MTEIEKILKMAVSQIGIKEIPANSNTVKYNTAYYGKAVSGSAYPWCCVFLWWVFRECKLPALFYNGKKTAYTPTLANYYKSINRFYSTPKPGDIVFYQFPGSSRINHVGIVEKVNIDGTIITIEGNTSTSNNSNGGAVMRRIRSTGSVAGYGRPKYSDVPSREEKPKEFSKPSKSWIKKVQKAIGANPDGIAGKETLGRTPTISATKNSKHAAVSLIQARLSALGYTVVGKADGIAGSKFSAAVNSLEMDMGIQTDGEVTAGAGVWKVLLGM